MSHLTLQESRDKCNKCDPPSHVTMTSGAIVSEHLPVELNSYKSCNNKTLRVQCRRIIVGKQLELYYRQHFILAVPRISQ